MLRSLSRRNAGWVRSCQNRGSMATSDLSAFPLSSRTSIASTFEGISSHNCHSQQGYSQPQWRYYSAYVSRHNVSMNVSGKIIQEYCQSHGLSAKSNATHVLIRECPFCSKPTQNKLSNLYKLYVESNSGAYFCHRCGSKGSWYDFKAQVSGYSSHGGGATPATTVTQSLGGALGGGRSTGRGAMGNTPPPMGGNHAAPTAEDPLPLPPARLSAVYSSMLLDDDNTTSPNSTGTEEQSSSSSSNRLALEYLQKVRGLSRATLRKYGVGRATYQFPSDQGYVPAECITFPWILRESELEQQESLRGVKTSKKEKTSTAKSVEEEEMGTSNPQPEDPFVTRRIKARAVTQKAWQRLDPPGGGWGLFGLHTVPSDATEIVLTEGEYDAMAVHQATGRPAISLPNGCRSLPVPVLPLLERFSKIYLWMDNDAPGQEGAQTFAKKLGLNRCYIVHCPDSKDANEALLQNKDLESYILNAGVVPHERLLNFHDLREQVLHELLEPDLYKGVEVPSLPQFTKIIKGFRRGEMTVLTGPTGSGKTTFLGQVSLDLAEQGINVLWGSFEIKNTRLLHKLLKQYSREALPSATDERARDKLNLLADRFENLPMHFLKFHGGSDIDEVLDAMEYAVYVHDTEHIILDNMQFMITRGSMGGSNWEKFDVQDIAIEKFRKFATQHNVHLTLVVHPRKEDETAKLNISSFYGSAKATQEADTVLILQHDGRRKYVEVKKNRYDGTLGYSPLFFESKSGRYSEMEGGSGSAAAAGTSNWEQQGGSVSFEPPHGKQPSFMYQKGKRQEPEVFAEGLDNHFDTMLSPGPVRA